MNDLISSMRGATPRTEHERAACERARTLLRELLGLCSSGRAQARTPAEADRWTAWQRRHLTALHRLRPGTELVEHLLRDAPGLADQYRTELGR